MGSAFQCTTNTLQLSVSTYLLKYALSLSRHQPEKNNNNLKSRQKFRLKKMQVQSVVQSLEFFFLLIFDGAASQWTKSARKYSLVFVLSSRPSPLKKILNIDPRQKQWKLEETDNAIIKSILSSLSKNFFYSYLKWSLTRKLTKFSVRFSTVALF